MLTCGKLKTIPSATVTSLTPLTSLTSLTSMSSEGVQVEMFSFVFCIFFCFLNWRFAQPNGLKTQKLKNSKTQKLIRGGSNS